MEVIKQVFRKMHHDISSEGKFDIQQIEGSDEVCWSKLPVDFFCVYPKFPFCNNGTSRSKVFPDTTSDHKQVEVWWSSLSLKERLKQFQTLLKQGLKMVNPFQQAAKAHCRIQKEPEKFSFPKMQTLIMRSFAHLQIMLPKIKLKMPTYFNITIRIQYSMNRFCFGKMISPHHQSTIKNKLIIINLQIIIKIDYFIYICIWLKPE